MPAMNPLSEIQARLQASVLDDAGEFDDVLGLLGRAAGGREPARGMSVYHGAYRARLREVLATVFERCWAYVGDADFERLCARHVADCPSRDPNLRAYGSAFPALVRRVLPAYPEAAEVAIMDWNLHAAFDAADAPLLDPASLASLSERDWQVARLAFQPSVAVAVFDWNAREIWQSIDRGETPPAAGRLATPEPYLFWRRAKRGHFRSMEVAEHAVLARLLQGAGFAEVCGWLASSHPERENAVGAWLACWLDEGVLSRVLV